MLSVYVVSVDTVSINYVKGLMLSVYVVSVDAVSVFRRC